MRDVERHPGDIEIFNFGAPILRKSIFETGAKRSADLMTGTAAAIENQSAAHRAGWSRQTGLRFINRDAGGQIWQPIVDRQSDAQPQRALHIDAGRSGNRNQRDAANGRRYRSRAGNVGPIDIGFDAEQDITGLRLDADGAAQRLLRSSPKA